MRCDPQVARHHLRRLTFDDAVCGGVVCELAHGVGLAGAVTTRGAVPSLTPYGYGSGPNVGMRSKLCTGTGEGSCHSIDFEAHGFEPAGTRAKTSDHTRLMTTTSSDAPSTN